MSDLFDQTKKAIDRAARDAEQAAREAAAATTRGLRDAAEHVAGRGSPVAQAAGQLHSAVSGEPAEAALDLRALPEATRAAFYGALFALANADGALDKDELALIVGLLDVEGLSPGVRRAVYGYAAQPPRLLDALRGCAGGDERLRFGLMLNLVDVAWANDLASEEQRYALGVARRELGVGEEQMAAIEAFASRVRDVRDRGVDDAQAADAVRAAAGGLAAAGVPIAAVYLSGSVVGLSAAGITSGLAALGLGLGMVPGIGVAVLIGLVSYMGVTRALAAGARQSPRVALALEGLDEMAELVAARCAELDRDESERRRAEAVEMAARLRALRQIRARLERQAGGEAAP